MSAHMRRPVVRAALALAVTIAAAGLPAQTPSAPDRPGTGFIAGVVIDWTTRKPVPEAVVTVTPETFATKAPGIPQRVMTDSSGRFAFAGLPALTLLVRATKPSYSTTSANATIALHDAERIPDLTLVLMKRASIGGRVLDDLGDPVVGVLVRAHRRVYAAGLPRLDAGASARTDDRGVYRIPDLMPGDYVVAVPNTQVSLPIDAMTDYMNAGSPTNRDTTTDILRITSSIATLGSPDVQRVGAVVLQAPFGRYYPPGPADPQRAMSYPTTFAPSATAVSGASVVSVASGDQRGGVDIQLSLVPAVAVSGTVVGPDGPVARANLRLTPVSWTGVDSPDFSAAATLSDPGGRFTFLNVPAGQYTLSARKEGNLRGSLILNDGPWAEEPLAVATTPIDDLRVSLRPPVRVTGQLKFDGTSPLPKFDNAQRMGLPILILATADARRLDVFSDPFNAPAEVDGAAMTFAMTAMGGRYVATGLGMAPWVLRSMTVDGRDIMQSPIDLKQDLSGVVATFIDKPARLAGTVRTAQGGASRETAVLLFPADPAQWTSFGALPRRFARTTTSLAGAYHLDSVLAGDYFLVAAIETPSDPAAIDLPNPLTDWQNPAFLGAISRLATRVHVDDGGQRTIDLKVLSVR